ncbi:hypothetical protein BLNAU_11106 [Blattamonas nauphoetae]|uniref:Uncharacterized protein n=1 Tax=Blattamonas nauphoetae TaxID=2049346 RepID=A0ABQ9XQH7_9EUKA|nr:hypothetical protein BLNAU_11106 [Blattamonas nauphoetae]
MQMKRFRRHGLMAHFDPLLRPSLGRSRLRQLSQKHAVFRHSSPHIGWPIPPPRTQPNPSCFPPSLHPNFLQHTSLITHHVGLLSLDPTITNKHHLQNCNAAVRPTVLTARSITHHMRCECWILRDVQSSIHSNGEEGRVEVMNKGRDGGEWRRTPTLPRVE